VQPNLITTSTTTTRILAHTTNAHPSTMTAVASNNAAVIPAAAASDAIRIEAERALHAVQDASSAADGAAAAIAGIDLNKVGAGPYTLPPSHSPSHPSGHRRRA
jgi:hypothetical protein